MINIIGAGPIGSYTAYLLAKKGFKVNVYEEHDEIGLPVQCTGITTKQLGKIIDAGDVVVNETKGIIVHSPNDEVEFRVNNLVLDRTKFDSMVAEMAENSGAKIFLSRKYVGNNRVLNKKRNNNIKIRGTLIGADGPRSDVAKYAGIYGDRNFLYGVQGVVKRKCDPDAFEVWLGSIAPGFFAWSVPESSKISRVGLAMEKDAAIHFQDLLKKLSIRKKDIICMQGGLIPLFNPKIQTKKHNTYLVGDAAAQVKATTGGGIIPGMIAVQSLAKDIEGKCSYESEWKKKIGFELRMHLLMRKMLNKFSDNDYNDLIGMVKREKIKPIIEKHDREFPVKLAFELLWNEPRLLKFGWYLF